MFLDFYPGKCFDSEWSIIESQEFENVKTSETLIAGFNIGCIVAIMNMKSSFKYFVTIQNKSNTLNPDLGMYLFFLLKKVDSIWATKKFSIWFIGLVVVIFLFVKCTQKLKQTKKLLIFHILWNGLKWNICYLFNNYPSLTLFLRPPSFFLYTSFK